MKYFIYVINCLLVVAIPSVIITGTARDTKTVRTTIEVKKVNSLKLEAKTEVKNEMFAVTEKEEVTAIEKQEETEKKQTKEIKQETIPTEEETKVVSNPVEQAPIEQKPVSDVLETLTGKMSGYGPDCRGCSGYTSSGHNTKSSIYYQDSTYGNVRILAGDRSLKLGSIVRIKNSKLGTFLGIVLDRGNAIGIGKTYLFDLLFQSENEAASYGVSFNVTFEVLRYGY